MRDGGVARTEIRGGHASLGEERNIGPAKLGAHLKAVPFDQRLNERITESGASSGREIGDLDRIAILQRRCKHRTHVGHGLLAGSIGGETMVDPHHG